MDETRSAKAKVALVIQDCVIPDIIKWERTMNRLMPEHLRAKVLGRAFEDFKSLFMETKFHTRSRGNVYFVFHISLPAMIKSTRKGIKGVEQEVLRGLVLTTKEHFESFVLGSPVYEKAYTDMIRSQRESDENVMFGAMNMHTDVFSFTVGMFLSRPREDLTQLTDEDVTRAVKEIMSSDQLCAAASVPSSASDPAVRERELQEAADRAVALVCDNLALLMRTCSSCKRRGVKLDVCSGCESVWYCDTKCQRDHWYAAHKQVCTRNPQPS